jgi:membrane associated rhomboid family serine protease
MIPISDDVPSRTMPFITIGLIAANVLVYFYQALLGSGADPQAAHVVEAFVTEFGAIPCRLSGSCALADQFPHPFVTIFTAMFLHGGLFHVGGNMLYLWIFGNNVEDTLGHGRFLLFYLVSGVAAAFAQTLVNPASTVPMIGASGAVSGVLGAYLLLFPYARVLVLLIFGFFIRPVYVPALIVLGFWIVVQFVNGLITVRASALGGAETGGTAWFAHIGGFLAGIVLLFLMRRRPGGRL